MPRHVVEELGVLQEVTPPEASWLHQEPPRPLQPDPLHPAGRTPHEPGYELEGDERHPEILTRALNLAKTRILTAPGEAKAKDGSEEALEGNNASLYMAHAARGKFVGHDRPDIQYAVKELCKTHVFSRQR